MKMHRVVPQTKRRKSTYTLLLSIRWHAKCKKMY